MSVDVPDVVGLALDELHRDESVCDLAPAEAYVFAYTAGWDKCLEYVHYLESKFNREDLQDDQTSQ